MDAAGRRTAALGALFFGSGAAALIYEIVWFQQLTLVLGATSISLAILLTSFLGGMCLGSLAAPRWSPHRSPLTNYALLELLIGLYGLASLWLLPMVGDVYTTWGTPGQHDLVWRSVLCGVVLMPPTLLMGATLPVVARSVEATRDGVRRLGWFYGANTLGAVAGCLIAGLVLLRVYDVVIATIVAAVLNLALALIAWRLSRKDLVGAPVHRSPRVATRGLQGRRATTWTITAVTALSGFTALGSETVWTRLLGLLFGPSSYTFSILLAVFLLGLGLGSLAGAHWERRTKSPTLALATTQLLLIAVIPYAAWMIADVLPYWWGARDAGMTLGVRMACDVVRAAATVLPATFLWGASFPLAVAAASGGSNDASRLVGRLYGANTLGAIAGALGITLIVHPWGGGQFAQQTLTVIAGLSGCLILLARSASEGIFERFVERSTNSKIPSLALRASVPSLALAAVAAAGLCVPPVPRGLLTYGRSVHLWPTARKFLFVREGVDSSVVVSVSSFGNRCFSVAGKMEATTSPSDMRTQRLLGHWPAAVHRQPKSVLVVGCGSGMTAGACGLHPSVERIVLCEIESAVIDATREFFALQNYAVLDDPRTQIVVDDARHFLATTKEKFDVITTDPIHPWVRGSSALYTEEFYALCRNRLNPGGVITQWVPLYESNVPAVKCELATLLKVFPETLVFSGESGLLGYDLVVVGTTEHIAPSVRTVLDRLQDDPRVRRSLAEVGLGQPRALANTFVCYGRQLEGWLADAEINRDRNLRLQFLAGLTPDAATQQQILQELTAHRRVLPMNLSQAGDVAH